MNVLILSIHFFLFDEISVQANDHSLWVVNLFFLSFSYRKHFHNKNMVDTFYWHFIARSLCINNNTEMAKCRMVFYVFFFFAFMKTHTKKWLMQFFDWLHVKWMWLVNTCAFDSHEPIHTKSDNSLCTFGKMELHFFKWNFMEKILN